MPPLVPGAATPVPVKLPRGTWSLSVQYTGQVPVRLQLGRRAFELPANTTRAGNWWPAMSVRSDGRQQELLVIAERESRLTPTTIAASVSRIVAVREEPRQRVPLRQACGQLVDWYRLAAGRKRAERPRYAGVVNTRHPRRPTVCTRGCLCRRWRCANWWV